uniref:Uncharacterized protein n=1 Tax=Glossina austeni TaxID=7395 RepID=A0A1A9V7Z8_GLOAU
MKIVILCVIWFLVPNVWSECVLQIPDNKENAPLWKKNIGNRWLKFPYITNRVQLQHGEIVKGYCATKFKDIVYSVEVRRNCDYYDYECKKDPMRRELKKIELSDNNITIECSVDSLKYESGLLNNRPILECDEVKWTVNMKSVQDSDTKTLWCKEDHQIFELSTNNMDQNRTLAHICYDMEEISLQAVKYTAIKRTNEAWNVNKFVAAVLNDLPEASLLSSEVKFLNSTLLHTENDVLQRYLETLSKENPWLKLARYEYAQIIQSSPFINHYNQYNQLLDILWWHDLRVTNWQRFLKALEEHSAVNSYTIYTGTMGAVQIPIWSNPGEFQFLDVQNGFANNTIPQYIWTYLESSDGKNPDLYVFGYNSPYAEFFHTSEVKFCADTCSDFNWLKDARSSFDYSNFGIVFCCSPESVKASPYGGKLPYKISTPVLDIPDKDINASIGEEKVKKLEKSRETVESTENPEVVEKLEKSEEPQTLGNFIYIDRNSEEGSGY